MKCTLWNLRTDNASFQKYCLKTDVYLKPFRHYIFNKSQYSNTKFIFRIQKLDFS